MRLRASFSTLAVIAGLCVHARAAAKPVWEEVSGEKALEHVRRLVEIGPRPPGSEGIEKARAYIQKQLESCGWEVSRQTFTDRTPRGAVTFVNLIARFKGKKAKPSFLLCSHYDSKLYEAIRFVGANDSGSSTGLLLEMARVFSARPELAARLELVFFDGEEAYEEFTSTDGLYGSRHFANELKQSGKAKQYRGGLLFDMVGDKSLVITLSPDSPAAIVRDLFAAAEKLQARQHFTYFHSPIVDDHAPINAIGIPMVDLIDFDYPPWHTADDTLDKLSPDSLRIVGSVAACYLSEFALK